jgi:hypothetical protein
MMKGMKVECDVQCCDDDSFTGKLILPAALRESQGRAQAVSRRPLTAEARVGPCGVWWTKWHWDRFSPVNVIPPWLHTHVT